MNIGCDIIENIRLKGISETFVNNILTDKEKELYKIYGLEFLAGRFAAKEAVIKCLNKKEQIDLKDIEILKSPTGSPTCNIENIVVSISHEKDYTIAYALKTK